ncbi:hypothetical protein E4665_16635 [Sporolactobacillus shoreae]|uniref:Uncharacterized protein n=1 Tax=Sporolactobacillus shoreae TaxID=1465501 RepID=A0A4Z0GJG1_9BACL|nr:hypothetical protein [Sporolactobacillus shoreae]TGA96131.1 hypothetical protein E4665_16635 [Sporolactobacillus shoreae]
MKPYLSLFWSYTLVHVLSVPLYYVTIIVAAFSTDSEGIVPLTFVVLYTPIILIHLILFFILFLIKRKHLSLARQSVFGGAYLAVLLLLYSVILFTSFI